MASGRLSFSIALNMVTAQFKQGAEQVKNALRNIQYQVLGMASALGAGAFGVSELVSRFVDVARETNRARMALRNISGDAAMFGKNMNYLTNLAQQYGQDLNTLTTNFARFSAASNAAGVSLADQEKIYSSITKSITAFGLGGEEANLTFMALGQMMSKGKISSEELRRQMGERIPIAMQAMANAAGVTIQQLDKMLKNGEIYSKDVLPRFAEELDKLTGSINVDNIETSVNRLKNAFIKLTDDLKIGEYYKKIVDGATKMLSTIQSMFTTFVGIIVGGGIGKIFNAFVTLRNSVLADNAKILANKIKAEEQAVIATANRVAAEKKFSEISVLYNKAADEEKIKYYAQYKAAESNMDKMRLRETAAIKAKEVAVNANAALTTQTVWGAAWTKIAVAAKAAWVSVLGMLKAFAPMAILMVLGAIVGKIIEARNATAELRKISAQYKNDMARAGDDNTELVRIRAIIGALNDKRKSQETIKGLQNELMGILGMEVWNRDEVNSKLATKIRLLKEAARAEVAANKIANTESTISELAASVGLNSNDVQSLVTKLIRKGVNIQTPGLGLKRGKDASATYNGLSELGIDTSNTSETNKLIGVLKAVAQKNRGLNTANTDLRNAVANGVVIAANPIKTSGGGTTPTVGGKTNKDAAEEAARAALDALAGAMKPAIASMNTSDDFTEGLKKYTVSTTAMPVQGTRDTTFDYKKSELEKLQEQYDIVNDHWEELKKIAPEALDEINRKEKELMSLSDALKLAELKEDIENLNKDIFSESIDGITGFANSIDSIANSWERVANADMSGWDRMIAIINALGDTINGVIGAWETYQTIQDLINTKNAAMTSLELANSTAEATASVAKSTAVAAGLKIEEAAYTGLMAAKSAAAYAEFPFVGVGLAAGQIAAMQGMILAAGIPKFEKGGIIGGSSYGGDKILGRFNSGERVLTRPDQAYLTKVLKGGTAGGGNVEFKIKGKELVGILQQENTRARR